MRGGGEEILWCGMDICEIAAAAAGYADLLTRRPGMVEDHDRAAAFSRADGRHHARRPGADDDDVAFALQTRFPDQNHVFFFHRRSKVNVLNPSPIGKVW